MNYSQDIEQIKEEKQNYEELLQQEERRLGEVNADIKELMQTIKLYKKEIQIIG